MKLQEITLFNPTTGRYEKFRLTLEIDPFSKCILRIGFVEDGKGGSHDHNQESP